MIKNPRIKHVQKFAKRKEETYFVRYDYFNLHELIGTKKQHIKVATCTPSQYIFDPITKGYLLKYRKKPLPILSIEFDKSILAQSDVITLKSFNVDKHVKVYYKDYANLENTHAEYV